MIVVAATVLNALWHDALLVIGVWLLLRAWPRINAATRYAVWSAALIAAFVVPVITTVLFFTPAQRAAVMPPSTQGVALHVHGSSTPVRRSSPFSIKNDVMRASSDGQTASGAKANAAQPNSNASPYVPALPPRLRVTLPWPVALAVFAAWALLAAYALAGLLVGLWRLERLKSDALPLPVDYRDAMPQWNRANKGRRPVRLCVSDAVDVPVAIGLFDAMILIPRELLERLSPAEVEQISLHELAHLRRADDWSNCLQRLIIAALGWNPAALFVAQQLELEREVACDDWVLASVGAVRPYAMCLTKMAETAAWPHHPMPAPGVFTTRKQISLRIERLLGSGRDIATNLALGPTAAAVAAVGALALAIAFVAPSIAAPAIAETAATTARVAAKAAAPQAARTAAHEASNSTQMLAQTTTRSLAQTTRATAQAAQPSASPKTVVITKTVVERAPGLPYPPAPPHPLASDYGDAISRSVDRAIDGAAGAKSTAAIGAAAAAMGHGFAKSWGAEVGKIVAQEAGQYGVHMSKDGKSCVGCDLHGVNWSGRDLRGADYTGVDFTDANLTNANLSDSKLNGADFSRANLSNASFRGAHLTGCDFSHANLTGADFSNAWMSGCEFTGARLQTAQLRSVLNGCKGCDFAHADLSGLDLRGVRINGDDFSGADLRNVNFAGAEIVGSDFSRARLDGANFAGATLNGCDLAGVDLKHVDLSKAKLIGMDFSNDNSSP